MECTESAVFNLQCKQLRCLDCTVRIELKDVETQEILEEAIKSPADISYSYSHMMLNKCGQFLLTASIVKSQFVEHSKEFEKKFNLLLGKELNPIDIAAVTKLETHILPGGNLNLKINFDGNAWQACRSTYLTIRVEKAKCKSEITEIGVSDAVRLSLFDKEHIEPVQIDLGNSDFLFFDL